MYTFDSTQERMDYSYENNLIHEQKTDDYHLEPESNDIFVNNNKKLLTSIEKKDIKNSMKCLILETFLKLRFKYAVSISIDGEEVSRKPLFPVRMNYNEDNELILYCENI